MSHAQQYLFETQKIALCEYLATDIEALVAHLVALRERKGRLWLAGLGGSAANASHAANDFQQLCGIEAHSLSENIAGVTARANDKGWEHALRCDYWRDGDALLVLSVGGGSGDVSTPLMAVIYAAKGRLPILGIVGKDGGYTALNGDCVVIVPTVEPSRVTPHTEGWQSVILHCIVSHPDLQRNACKW